MSQQDSAETNPLSQSKPSFAYIKSMRETNWKNAAIQAILAVTRQTRAESILYLPDLARNVKIQVGVAKKREKMGRVVPIGVYIWIGLGPESWPIGLSWSL
jgi:hypothetical protein